MNLFVVVALGESFPQDVEVFRTRGEAESYVIRLAVHLCCPDRNQNLTYAEARDRLQEVWYERATIYETELA